MGVTQKITCDFSSSLTAVDGLGFGPVSAVSVNTTDPANTGPEGTTPPAVAVSFTNTYTDITQWPFLVKGTVNPVDMYVSNMVAGTSTVLRVSVPIIASFQNRPSGNLFGNFASAAAPLSGGTQQTTLKAEGETIIPTGYLFVHKLTDPAKGTGQSAPSFGFNLAAPGNPNPGTNAPFPPIPAYDSGAFSLQDTQYWPTAPTASQLVPFNPSTAVLGGKSWTIAGTYTLTETSLPTGWSVKGISASSDKRATVPLVVSGNTVSFELQADEKLIVTYTNKFNAKPALDITKTVTTSTGDFPGVDSLEVLPNATVKYLYKVTNPSNVSDPPGAPALNVAVVDDNGTPSIPGDDFAVTLTGLTDEDSDGQADDLAAGATATGAKLVSRSFSEPTTVVNTATATATGLSDTDTATVIYKVGGGDNPQITVKKYVSSDGVTWDDANVATGPYFLSSVTPQFKFVVTNTGNVTLSNITLTDTDFTFSSAEIPASLAADASFEITKTQAWAIGQHMDTANASGTYYYVTADAEPDSAYYFGAAPALTIVKTATPGTYDHVGQVISYSYKVTNSGNVTLYGDIVVSDTKIPTASSPTLTLPAAGLAPDAFVTLTGSYTITQADLDAGSVTNYAYAKQSATPSRHHRRRDRDRRPEAGAHHREERQPDDLRRSVGDVISYSYEVTNSGNVTSSGRGRHVRRRHDHGRPTCHGSPADPGARRVHHLRPPPTRSPRPTSTPARSPTSPTRDTSATTS